MLRLPCECYECLRVLTDGLENVTNVLMNYTNVLPTLPLSCNFLTNNDEAVIGINSLGPDKVLYGFYLGHGMYANMSIRDEKSEKCPCFLKKTYYLS